MKHIIKIFEKLHENIIHRCIKYMDPIQQSGYQIRCFIVDQATVVIYLNTNSASHPRQCQICLISSVASLIHTCVTQIWTAPLCTTFSAPI